MMGARLTVGSTDAVVQLVGTQTISGAAVSGVSFTSLNLEGVVAYKLLASIINVNNGCPIQLEYNADSTVTNYKREYAEAAGAGISAASPNNNQFGGVLSDAGNISLLDATFKKVAGREPTCLFAFGNGSYNTPSYDAGLIIWNSTNNVTRIDITSAVASQIAIGSKFSLYKFI